MRALRPALPILGLLLSHAIATPAWADTPPAASLCQAAVARAEAGRRLPDGFLAAIARVETGRPDPATGVIYAWPWSVNAEGTGTFYASKAEATEAVRALRARGVTSIDVGCLQVNLQQHKDAFASLDQAFDPDANAAYAADFLRVLFQQTGSWPLAAAAYHSLTPGIGSAYQQRVLAEWAVPQNEPRAARRARLPRAGPPRPTAIAPPPRATEIAAASPRPSEIKPMQVTAAARTGVAATPAAQFPLARPFGVTGRGLAAYRLLPTRLALSPG